MSHTGLKNNSINSLKSLLPEVDYQALIAQLPRQSHPRRKLKELQNKGYLTRLKKGFYVISQDLTGRPYSPQIVANLLYGPSYLSLEYALAFYSLIPERVEVFTSITSQKNKSFETPIGLFTYRHLSPLLYPLGVTLAKTDDQRTFLIATPEKALMDLFQLNFSGTPKQNDIEIALTEDLRLDLQTFKEIMNRDLLEVMKPHYRNRRWNKLLIQFLLENL